MKIHESLLTFALSVGTTLLVTQYLNGPSARPAQAASPDAIKELVVERLIVRKELIVSDTGEP